MALWSAGKIVRFAIVWPALLVGMMAMLAIEVIHDLAEVVQRGLFNALIALVEWTDSARKDTPNG